MRALFLVMLLLPSVNQAEEIQIVLWNPRRLFDVDTVNQRTDDLRQFGRHYADANVVILDEVCSLAVVNAARDKIGFAGCYTACSDFAQNDSDTFNSLEVGFISRFPLTNVVEYDPTPDNTGEPNEEPLVNIGLPGLADVETSRGFLTADIPALGLTLVGTHLKSSRGQAGEVDHDNARKREFVAASMAKFVDDKLAGEPTATVVVAGDLNVGETDMKKNGFRLEQDFYDRAEGDLYDDTHVLLSAGLVNELHMASLTKALGTETYDDPQFAGSGPIDCIYVVGKQSSDFMLAKRSSKTFGSDHFAVSTRFQFTGVPRPAAPPRESQTGVRIRSLLPNPQGEDEGNEWVKLVNNGRDAVNLVGWKLRDKAGHEFPLPDVFLAPRREVVIRLGAHEMPLNNDGDEVELLDAKGRSVDEVRYSAGQVMPGREIRFR